MRLYSTHKILKQLNLNHDQFVDVCVMAKNDFNPSNRIQNIGLQKAYKGILTHGSIDAFVREIKKENKKKEEFNKKTKGKKQKRLTEIPEDLDFDSVKKEFYEYSHAKSIPEGVILGIDIYHSLSLIKRGE